MSVLTVNREREKIIICELGYFKIKEGNKIADKMVKAFLMDHQGLAETSIDRHYIKSKIIK